VQKQHDEIDVDRYTFLICSLQQNSNSSTCVFGVNEANATTTDIARHRATPEMKYRYTSDLAAAMFLSVSGDVGQCRAMSVVVALASLTPKT